MKAVLTGELILAFLLGLVVDHYGKPAAHFLGVLTSRLIRHFRKRSRTEK
jgi:uncharacterized membrane protein